MLQSQLPACQGLRQPSKQVTETGRATEQACQGGRKAQLSHIGYPCRALPGQGGTLFPHTHPCAYLCWPPFADWDRDISLAVAEPDRDSGVTQGHTGSRRKKCGQPLRAVWPRNQMRPSSPAKWEKLGYRASHFMPPSRHTPRAAADLGSQRDRVRCSGWARGHCDCGVVAVIFSHVASTGLTCSCLQVGSG